MIIAVGVVIAVRFIRVPGLVPGGRKHAKTFLDVAPLSASC
jgi:hypothetical protein